MVGGPQSVARRCEPLFGSFSRHVVYLGGPGSGQTAKLFNNALLMMNQANIADIVELATTLRMDPPYIFVEGISAFEAGHMHNFLDRIFLGGIEFFCTQQVSWFYFLDCLWSTASPAACASCI
jgi:3-hydroxyisobutyrate dehydrogenase-like beta-hydroxyacid dehydrogenase